MPFTFLTQQTMETNKNHVSSMYRARDRDRPLVRSRDLDVLETWFLLFLWFIGSRKSMACEPHTWSWRVTLYVKVTWPYKWPILTRDLSYPDRDLYMLETWFFLFPWFVGSKKSMACARDSIPWRVTLCQGHVTLQVTYFNSGPIRARDMTFLFPWFVGSRRSMA